MEIIGGYVRNQKILQKEVNEVRLMVHRDLAQVRICLWNLVDVSRQGLEEAGMISR